MAETYIVSEVYDGLALFMKYLANAAYIFSTFTAALLLCCTVLGARSLLIAVSGLAGLHSTV